MGSKICKVCKEKKGVQEYYKTGKKSIKTGKILRYGECKKCYNRIRSNSFRRQLSQDERYFLVHKDPRLLKKRVKIALQKKGLRK